jgi:hypothetical protein
MMLHILVELNIPALLLDKLLQAEKQAGLVRIRSFPEPSSMTGAAKTSLIVRREPLALVQNAESTYPRTAAWMKQGIEEVMGDFIWRAPCRILIAVPAVEALLFRRPDAIARAYGPVSGHLLEIGLISPRDALIKLDPNIEPDQVSLNIINELDETDIAALRAESPVRELLEFVEELQRDGVLATAAVGP